MSAGEVQSLIEQIKLRFRLSSYPVEMLTNRLLNMGLEEFLSLEEVLSEDGTPSQRPRAFESQGFPFKFFSQLDEAIMALGYFLDRLKSDEGKGFTLQVYAINRQKGPGQRPILLANRKSQTLHRTPEPDLAAEQ